MKTTVHILATVRKAELLPASLLVFKTLRVGFPEAEVRVWGNGLAGEFARIVEGACGKVGGRFVNLPARPGVAHDLWIEGLIQASLEPFWILDTDVVFWKEMELNHRGTEAQRAAFAGRFEPEIYERWTGTRRVERLQTGVMWIDAAGLREGMRAWACRVPRMMRASAEFPFVRQTFVGCRGSRRIWTDGRSTPDDAVLETLFYDTMAGCWQAGLGRAFGREENEAFEHLGGATYADLLGPAIGIPEYAANLRLICERPELARGLREKQERWYEEQAVGRVGIKTQTANFKPQGNPEHRTSNVERPIMNGQGYEALNGERK